MQLLTLYDAKRKQDDVVFRGSIKKWECEFQLEVPDVIICEIYQYFAAYTEREPSFDVFGRIVQELDSPHLETQELVLETILNLCGDTDVYPVTDEAVEHDVFVKLRENGFLFHSQERIRKLS